MAIGSIQGLTAPPVSNPPAPRPLPAAQSAGQIASNSQVVFYDPADTNHDGGVSPAEALAYALAHPEAALAKDLLSGAPSADTAYGANGSLATAPQNGRLDLKV